MNPFALSNVDLCFRISMTLIHFLWQGVVIAVLASLVNAAIRKNAASIRYLVSFCALLLMTLCPPVTFLLIQVNPGQPVEIPSTQKQAVSQSVPSPSSPFNGNAQPLVSSSNFNQSSPGLNGPTLPESVAKESFSSDESPATASQDKKSISTWKIYSPWIVAIYMLGVAATLARIMLAFGGGERLRKRGNVVESEELNSIYRRAAASLRVRVAPVLSTCDRICSPIIVGVIKPTILLPLAITTELTPSQIEAVLLHELAHIRRCDHITNLIQRVIESILFFHPAVWLLSRIVSNERENSCDDLVLNAGADATDYAELLVRVSELSQMQRTHTTAMTLAVSGHKTSRLRTRILRLLGSHPQSSIRLSRSILAGMTLAIFGGILGGLHALNLASATEKPKESDFTRIHLYKRAQGVAHYQKITRSTSGTTFTKIKEAFPRFAQGELGVRPATKWPEMLIVDLEKQNGDLHRIKSDLSRFWTEGNGDHVLHGADKLNNLLQERYYFEGSAPTWVFFLGSSEIELRAVRHAPVNQWWRPNGIGCGFEGKDRGNPQSSNDYYLSIHSSLKDAQYDFDFADAQLIDVDERSNETKLITFRPNQLQQTSTTLQIQVTEKSGQKHTVTFSKIKLNPEQHAQTGWGKSSSGFQVKLAPPERAWIEGKECPTFQLAIRYKGPEKTLYDTLESFCIDIDDKRFHLFDGQTGTIPLIQFQSKPNGEAFEHEFTFRFVRGENGIEVQQVLPQGPPHRHLGLTGIKGTSGSRIETSLKPDMSVGQHRIRIGFPVWATRPVSPAPKTDTAETERPYAFSKVASFEVKPKVNKNQISAKQRQLDRNLAKQHLDPLNYQSILDRYTDPDLGLATMFDSELNGGIRVHGGQKKAEQYYLSSLSRISDYQAASRVYSQLSVLFSTNFHPLQGEKPDYRKARHYAKLATQLLPGKISKPLIRARARLGMFPDETDDQRFYARLEFYKWLSTWDKESVRGNWIPLDYQKGREETYFPSFMRLLENIRKSEVNNLVADIGSDDTPYDKWADILERVPNTPLSDIAFQKVETMWGPSTSGVRSLLVNPSQAWPWGQFPEFKAHIRNMGKNTYSVAQAQQLCELEVDEKIYEWKGRFNVKSSHLPPGRGYHEIPITLDHHWHNKRTGKSLELSSGWHTARIVFLPKNTGSIRRGLAQLRVVSKPVSFRISDVAWGKPVDGVRTGMSFLSTTLQTKEQPLCYWYIQNVSDKPRAVWLGEEDLVAIKREKGNWQTYTRSLRATKGIMLMPTRQLLKPGEHRVTSLNLWLLKSSNPLSIQSSPGLISPLGLPGKYAIKAVYDPYAPEALFGGPENRKDYPDIVFQRVESATTQLNVVGEPITMGSQPDGLSLLRNRTAKQTLVKEDQDTLNNKPPTNFKEIRIPKWPRIPILEQPGAYAGYGRFSIRDHDDQLEQMICTGWKDIKSQNGVLRIPSEKALLFTVDSNNNTSLSELRSMHPSTFQALSLPLQNRIDDRAMPTIGKLTGLVRLELGGSDISDASLAHLKNLDRLKFLSLQKCPISDEAISTLSDLKSLKEFNIRNTWITKEGARRLQVALPDCNVSWLAATDRIRPKSVPGAKKVSGTWIGDFLLSSRIVIRKDGTFEQSTATPENDHSKDKETGTWELEGDRFTRTIKTSQNKNRVGLTLERRILKVNKDWMQLQWDGKSKTTYHRVRDFHGFEYISSDTPEPLPTFTEKDPDKPGTYRLIPGIDIIYSGVDGEVYYLKKEGKFYLIQSPIGSSSRNIYGPFPGDPRKKLKLPNKKVSLKKEKDAGSAVSKIAGLPSAVTTGNKRDQNAGFNPPRITLKDQYSIELPADKGFGSGFFTSINGKSALVSNIHVLSFLKNRTASLPNGKNVKLDQDCYLSKSRDSGYIFADEGGYEFRIADFQKENISVGDDVYIILPGAKSVDPKNQGKIIKIHDDSVETTATFTGGNSGSPLIHKNTGMVIGVVSRFVYGNNDRAKKYFCDRVDQPTNLEKVDFKALKSSAVEIYKYQDFTSDLDHLLYAIRRDGSIPPDPLKYSSVQRALKFAEENNFKKDNGVDLSRLKEIKTMIAGLKVKSAAVNTEIEKQLASTHWKTQFAYSVEHRTWMIEQLELALKKLE